MIYPKGRVLQEKLDPALFRIDYLVLSSEKKLLSGYLIVSADNYEGVLIFVKGKLSSAFDCFNGVDSNGESAKQQIYSKGKEKSSLLGIHSMPEKTIKRLLSKGKMQLMHKNLSSDDTKLNSLIEILLQEGVNGCIGVTALKDDWLGVVFLAPDQLADNFLRINGKDLTGQSALDEIVSLSSELGAAAFNVFSSQESVTPTNSSSTPVNSSSTAVNSSSTAVKRSSTAVKSSSTAVSSDPSPEQLMATWSEFIAAVEKTVEPYSKKSFLFNFKHVLNEISGDYPFLHCSSGTFNYKSGKMTSLEPLSKRLSEGVGTALSKTVAKMDAQAPKVNLAILVKGALYPLIQSHAAVVRHFSLISSCDLLNISTHERVLSVAYPFLGKSTEMFIERQCMKKMGVTPESFKPEHFVALGEQIEKSAGLLISKSEVQQLTQIIRSMQV